MELEMNYEITNTYEEATQIIKRVGILPLAPLIPGHPSLGSITEPNQWHSGTIHDPWSWRVRFPGDGTAAYGKMFKKKAILVSRDWFPYVLKVLGHSDEPDKRYKDGLLSKAALDVYHVILDDEGIDTRELRGRVGMKAKEMKLTFDNALLELQGNLDIVISGVKEKVNDKGEPNGWNSTSYETVSHWMLDAGITELSKTREEAGSDLNHMLKSVCTPEALKYLQKQFHISD
ncbi:AlkZ-related protein [Paenibacillus crassostreae]|nr:hypothetical protein [Paenibacillus crassostreae]